ncbi:hypothetical protein EUGRSUZ_H04304 [Eucalyptus grandis]|uniref:Uncharacterized protein n=2 Tax=Eucalyptus grandis TaxID=71139 RepID=A0ACC3JVP6_EUCGR|nr:hypothetical protein EUGRSUZ_H04304 [Eucalyptus grandis]
MASLTRRTEHQQTEILTYFQAHQITMNIALRLTYIFLSQFFLRAHAHVSRCPFQFKSGYTKLKFHSFHC